MDDVLAWLLDPAEPAVRAQALVDLLGRAPDDPEVLAARREAPQRGAGARLLAGLDAGARDLYRPKYGAPFHRLVALAEVGVTAEEPRAGALLDACLAEFLGDGPEPRDAEICVVGNLARAAIRMGRGNDARVGRALAWIEATQFSDGGWHCWRDTHPFGSLDAWEGLGAYAALPPARRPETSVARGVEFFLARGLGLDDTYEPWRRLHFPTHYYYDVLLGLDLVTALGAATDPRLAPALAWLESRRGADARWRLDASHPDLAEGADYDLRGTPTPLEIEPPGAPSRWATLRARRVLRRAGRATPDESR